VLIHPTSHRQGRGSAPFNEGTQLTNRPSADIDLKYACAGCRSVRSRAHLLDGRARERPRNILRAIPQRLDRRGLQLRERPEPAPCLGPCAEGPERCMPVLRREVGAGQAHALNRSVHEAAEMAVPTC
jgi:hypothetical protein